MLMKEMHFVPWPVAIGLALAFAVGCVSNATDAQAPTAIETDTYVAVLPPAPDWECEPLAANEADGTGPGTVCGRQLEGNRTVVAAAVEEFSEEIAAQYANEAATAVLAVISEAQAEQRRARGDEVLAFSDTATGYATERAGATCLGSREETIDRGASTRAITRTFVCIDPGTRRPIRLTYLEEFPDAAGSRPTFETEANQFFEGLRFLPAR